MDHNVGYGVLAPENFSDISPDEEGNTLLFGQQAANYGSLGNVSDSTNDSYHRWYDYDSMVNRSYQDEQSYHGTAYETETDYGAYSCNQSCCTDTDGAAVLSPDRESINYISRTDASGTEETFYYLEKNVTGSASTALVGWNIVNLLLSTSLLCFPFAIAMGGYVVLPFIFLICFVTNYTSRILVNMMYEKSTDYHSRRRRVRIRVDYVDLAQDVFNSRKGAWFIQTFQVFEMVAICVLNICVLGRLTHEIVPGVNIHGCTAIAAVLALPTFFIRKLAVIGWMQTIGVFSLAMGFIIVQGYCLGNVSKWSISSVPKHNISSLPIAIGIIIYAFGIHGVMPGLEEQMGKRKRFGFVINLTFFLAAGVQCFFGFTNAILYGEKTNQVITVDLQNHFALGVATACFIGISILSHFSLPTFVVLEKLDNAIHQMFPCCPSNGENNFNLFLSICLRIAVMGFSLGVAVLVPYFAYLMAFVGSTITVIMSLVVPCSFHLKLCRAQLRWWQITIDGFIILFGILCFMFGSYFAFMAIFTEHSRNEGF